MPKEIKIEKPKIYFKSTTPVNTQIIKGDCFTPIGVYANIEKACLKIRARLFSTDGLKYVEVRKTSCAMDAKHLGRQCAKEILSKIKFKFKK